MQVRSSSCDAPAGWLCWRCSLPHRRNQRDLSMTEGVTSWWQEAAAVIFSACAASGAEAGLEAPPARLALEQVNAMPDVDFRRVFANVVECCPEVAVALASSRPLASVDTAAEAAAAFLDALPAAAQLRVLLLHPDLAGRLAQRGLLTAESQREQQAAGVLCLPPRSATRLHDLNARYRERFGFPYVVCAREKGAEQILEDLEARVQRSRAQELRAGIEEVKKICRLRLQELMADD